MNVPRLSEIYFLSCTMDGVRIGPGSFLAHQLFRAAISTKGRIVIGGYCHLHY